MAAVGLRVAQEPAVEEPAGLETRGTRRPGGPYLPSWLTSQGTNLARHAAALRPFRPGEFGSGAASPSEAHRVAANRLLGILRASLLRLSREVSAIGARAVRAPTASRLRAFTALKDRGQAWVEATERVWDFYFELFNQRQTQVAPQLLASDRIALDCYQVVYTNLGAARSIPSPPPFSYMETGFAPATFRRGVVLSRLGRRANPFPLVKLPYHRLVNPWTLGAIPHEVSHNLQADLGLWEVVPRTILERLLRSGTEAGTARTWARYHKEIFADLCGLLLTGPAFVASLMDIVGKSQPHTVAFNPRGVHPTPYLRVFINLELLRRTGFEREADAFGRTWDRLYPRPLAEAIPESMRATFGPVHRAVVDVVCFTPYRQLGGKSLAQVVRFGSREQKMIEEAAGRLAAGTDPGILPERFLIGASRWALEHRLARPGVIAKNFYDALGRR